MKLGKSVLIEIVEIVREGLSEGKDISDGLRAIDVHELLDQDGSRTIELSQQYLKDHGRI